MKLFDEIMRRLGADEELVFNGVKYVVFDGRCGYFENVKGIGDFSGEAVEILLKKGKLLVSGKNLYIRCFVEGDLAVYGQIESVARAE